MLAEIHRTDSGRLRLDWTPPLIDGDLGFRLAFFARAMASDAPIGVALVRAILGKGTFHGFALFVECWTNDEMTPEQDRNRTTALADIVGSYESRTVLAVDAYGNLFCLYRKRGEKPFEVPSEHNLVGGTLAALVRMTLAVAQHLPADRADVSALRKLAASVRDVDGLRKRVEQDRMESEHKRA